jgi:hypothetical protein
MSAIIRRFPFVRAVFISGELSKGVASKKGDIDFFVVTADRRVWVCRTLFALFKKVFLLGSKKLFCYNHIVSESHLRITDQNVYTAIEIATLQPLANPDMHQRFLDENEWVRGFFPNATRLGRRNQTREAPVPTAEQFVNVFTRSTDLDRLDRWLQKRWEAFWRKRYPSLTEDKRLSLFRCEEYLSTAYARDYLGRILSNYDQRLQRFGLSL